MKKHKIRKNWNRIFKKFSKSKIKKNKLLIPDIFEDELDII